MRKNLFYAGTFAFCALLAWVSPTLVDAFGPTVTKWQFESYDLTHPGSFLLCLAYGGILVLGAVFGARLVRRIGRVGSFIATLFLALVGFTATLIAVGMMFGDASTTFREMVLLWTGAGVLVGNGLVALLGASLGLILAWGICTSPGGANPTMPLHTQLQPRRLFRIRLPWQHHQYEAI